MAAVIIPPSPPYKVAAGTIVPRGEGLYNFSALDRTSYSNVARASLQPLGKLSLLYATLYNLPQGGLGPH